MNLQDFESQYHTTMDQTLNEMQTAILLLAQLQLKIDQVGSSIQGMSQIVEEFINQQKAN